MVLAEKTAQVASEAALTAGGSIFAGPGSTAPHVPGGESDQWFHKVFARENEGENERNRTSSLQLLCRKELVLSCFDKKDALNPNASVSEIFQSPEYRHNHLFIAYLIQNYSNNPLSIAEANARKRLTARLPSVSA